ncbi:MAG TPA: insulinase family protein [Clostridiales bacterium]|nr:insulinase family protein [Clostridiales bacterium]
MYVIPKKGYARKYAVYATKYGSIDNEFRADNEKQPTKVPDGIAHFLEHKLFEEEKGNIFNEFSKLGAQPNAYTNFTTTAYLFYTTDNFLESLNLLLNFVSRPYFTDENVNKEKGIIAQEIRMYHDNPNWRVYFNLLKALYKNHPVRIDIAGTIESINSIDKDMLYKCYKTFYNPSNMVLAIVGDVDPDRVFKETEDIIKRLDLPSSTRIERLYPGEPYDVNKGRIQETMEVSTPLFAIGFKERNTGVKGKELMERDIITNICLDLLIGKSSRLYNKLYDQGLINETFEKGYSGQVEYGFSMIAGESSDPQRVVAAVMDEINLMNKEGLDDDYFNRIKKKHFGRFLSYFNSIEFIASNFIDSVFKDINMLEYLQAIQDMDLDRVQQRFAEHFNTHNFATSIIEAKK